jgi:hypothetical protein
MSRNMVAPIIDCKTIWFIIVSGVGINRTISISNTMKMTASKKNRVEKGRRAVFLGSNPHSKGEDFSRS